MKRIVITITMLFGLSIWVVAIAEIQFTNATAKDIGQAYGFCAGQDYSLREISKKFPSLSGSALLAEKEFSTNFESSLENMDAIMMKHAQDEWLTIKRAVTKQIVSVINIDQITEDQARQFIDLVRQRAKGNIESPVIETLLMFKSGYDRNPEQEFVDGYKYKYSNDGVGKSKGLAFFIEFPKTWAAKDGNRPNVVQKFVSQNGRGLELFLILVHEIPLQIGENISAADVREMLNPKDLIAFFPEGASLIKSGKLTLENLPGFWVHFKTKMSRARNTLEMETIMYTIFVKNKLLQLQGQVTTSVNGKAIIDGDLQKFEKLFDLIANSLVIPGQYAQSDKIGMTLERTDDSSFNSELDGDNFVLTLIISFLLTWVVGLTPPLLVRFLFLRRPIAKVPAAITVVLFWFMNILIFTALGSTSKTHGALLLVGWASYAILRKGAQKSQPESLTESKQEAGNIQVNKEKIRFGCPNCGSKYTAGQDQIGKQGNCKKCGHMMVVPKPNL